jgi:hypothetical protein
MGDIFFIFRFFDWNQQNYGRHVKFFKEIILWILLFIFSASAVQHGLWPPRSRGFVITQNNAPQSVGLLWTSDQLVAETSTWRHKHTQQKNIRAPGGIRTQDCNRRAAVDLRLRLRGHWDRHTMSLVMNYSIIFCLYTHKHPCSNCEEHRRCVQ